MPDSEFGDIIWKRIDPKTWLLSNNPPPSPTDQPVARDEYDRAYMNNQPLTSAGLGMTDTELNNFIRGMDMRKQGRQAGGSHMVEQRRPTGDYGRQWRRDLRNLEQGGLNGLVNRGDVWFTEEGDVYSRYPMRQSQTDRMMDLIHRLTPDEIQSLRGLGGGATQENPSLQPSDTKQSIDYYIKKTQQDIGG